MSSVLVIAVLTCLTVGCATIDYVGASYPPTTQVDLYFSESEVPREYRIIGQAMASGDEFVTASRLPGRKIDASREAISCPASRRSIARPERTGHSTCNESP